MRQKTRFSEMVSPEVGIFGMNCVAKSIADAQKKKKVFQLQSKGYARWVEGQFKRVLVKAGSPTRNFFRSDTMKSCPRQFPVVYMHKFVKQFPKSWHNNLVRAVMLPFAPWRKYRGISFMNFSFLIY